MQKHVWEQIVRQTDRTQHYLITTNRQHVVHTLVNKILQPTWAQNYFGKAAFSCYMVFISHIWSNDERCCVWDTKGFSSRAKGYDTEHLAITWGDITGQDQQDETQVQDHRGKIINQVKMTTGGNRTENTQNVRMTNKQTNWKLKFTFMQVSFFRRVFV